MFIHTYCWPIKATIRMEYWVHISEDNYVIMKREDERLE
jgi:hypothetical protein